MIIMINGAFGAGKTTMAHALCESLPGTMLFDPEEVGYMLRNVIPEERKQLEAPEGDFQDLDLWRKLTVEVGGRLIERVPDRSHRTYDHPEAGIFDRHNRRFQSNGTGRHAFLPHGVERNHP